jgi:hypothetical protein
MDSIKGFQEVQYKDHEQAQGVHVLLDQRPAFVIMQLRVQLQVEVVEAKPVDSPQQLQVL